MTDPTEHMLTFNINYGLQEVSCERAGCYGCNAAHRVPTGEATLTVVGPVQQVREAAALVFPDLAKVFNPPAAPEQNLPKADSAGAPRARRKALSASALDALLIGHSVWAGAFPDAQRSRRVRWTKLYGGRWNSEATPGLRIDGLPGVSSTWLAGNRNPMLDK